MASRVTVTATSGPQTSPDPCGCCCPACGCCRYATDATLVLDFLDNGDTCDTFPACGDTVAMEIVTSALTTDIAGLTFKRALSCSDFPSNCLCWIGKPAAPFQWVPTAYNPDNPTTWYAMNVDGDDCEYRCFYVVNRLCLDENPVWTIDLWIVRRHPGGEVICSAPITGEWQIVYLVSLSCTYDNEMLCEVLVRGNAVPHVEVNTCDYGKGIFSGGTSTGRNCALYLPMVVNCWWHVKARIDVTDTCPDDCCVDVDMTAAFLGYHEFDTEPIAHNLITLEWVNGSLWGDVWPGKLLRLTLQRSDDGGETWTDVTNWADSGWDDPADWPTEYDDSDILPDKAYQYRLQAEFGEDIGGTPNPKTTVYSCPVTVNTCCEPPTDKFTITLEENRDATINITVVTITDECSLHGDKYDTDTGDTFYVYISVNGETPVLLSKADFMLGDDPHEYILNGWTVDGGLANDDVVTVWVGGINTINSVDCWVDDAISEQITIET